MTDERDANGGELTFRIQAQDCRTVDMQPMPLRFYAQAPRDGNPDQCLVFSLFPNGQLEPGPAYSPTTFGDEALGILRAAFAGWFSEVAAVAHARDNECIHAAFAETLANKCDQLEADLERAKRNAASDERWDRELALAQRAAESAAHNHAKAVAERDEALARIAELEAERNEAIREMGRLATDNEETVKDFLAAAAALDEAGRAVLDGGRK